LEDSTVRFKAPDVLFASGSAELRPRFQEILLEFFPRYIRILHSEKYRDSILEVRIEGHTSSSWLAPVPPFEKYILNMKLSQERTRTTLAYVMQIPAITDKLLWLYERTTANGLSYSKRLLNPDGSENFARSQRVEFRVRADSESRISRIIEATQ
jgi:outer membrane protein OmpA-like peptidoglycan-associated protein